MWRRVGRDTNVETYTYFNSVIRPELTENLTIHCKERPIIGPGISMVVTGGSVD